MIQIDRSKVMAPTSLRSAAVGRELKRAERHLQSESAAAQQTRFRFDPKLLDASILKFLQELFRFKCAYCEQAVTNAVIDRFRPAHGALGLHGDVSPAHYWWLAFRWSNLYLACPECSRCKGSRFPVSPPTVRMTQRRFVDNESRLLLDPCVDEPVRDLSFDLDGRVHGRSERGVATIEIIELNRSALAAQRQAGAERIAELVRSLIREPSTSAGKPAPPSTHLRALQRAIAPDVPFSQSQRQCAARLLQAHDAGEVARILGLGDALAALVPVDERNHVGSTSSPEPGVDASASSFGFQRTIERIRLTNCGGIKALDVRTDPASGASRRPEAAATPAIVVIGENGCGKSTLLRALAIALEQPRGFYRDAKKLVGPFAQTATIEVWLSGELTPRHVTISAAGHVRATGGQALPLVAAYGAIRLPNAQAKGDVKSSRYRIGNLFDPFQPLLDLQAWLVDRPAAAFISAAQALKVLVPVGADAAFRKIPSKPPTIVVTTGTSRNGIALDSLSDGYRSVLGMAAHLMSLIEGRWQRTEDAEGIVLIDELENHLHPRWRMRILWALRGAFPRIQFVVSTHDPLCLRSARSGEVVVLHRVGADIAAATDLPPVSGLPLEQLLQSDYFGLNTVLDPEVEALQSRYMELRARTRRTAGERLELHRLPEQIDEKMRAIDPSTTFTGRDRREQMMLEAIDLGRERMDAARSPGERDKLSRETIELASELFVEAVSDPELLRTRR